MRAVFIRHRRVIAETVEITAAAASLVLGFLLRFEFTIEPVYLRMLAHALPLVLAAKVAVFRAFGLRHLAWRHIGFPDLMRIAAANAAASLASTFVLRAAIGVSFPRSVHVIDFLVCLTLVVGIRSGIKLLFEWRASRPSSLPRRAVIYGAGSAGVTVLTELRSDPGIGYRIVGFLDDDPSKRAMRIHGVRVLGGRAELPSVVKKHRVEEVLIAVPGATGSQMTAIVEQCHAAHVTAKRVPALAEWMERGVSERGVLAHQIRDVRLEDLLGRPAARWRQDKVGLRLAGRAVLVTGAAGSIGAELCRQLARHGPALLIGFDQSETGLYQIEYELRGKFPEVEFHPEVGSIQNLGRLEEVFRRHGPQSVYHAAAYKHVPMMEAHLCEAVENNVFGTQYLACAAAAQGAEDFVLVSSDKAVRPSSVMGATKRIAEMVCQAERNHTKFVSVRFGNVLGSSGSVIPRFRQQIAAGGPVTVTHPDMRRFFMTVEEAARLVLEAGAMGSGGEIFVLDMGEPVRIADLARKLVLLSGLRPDIDIPIVFSGTRQGEKMYEEVRAAGENTAPTPHAQIRVFMGAHPPKSLGRTLDEMRLALDARDPSGVLLCLRELLPDYNPSSLVLRQAAPAGTPQSAVHALV